MKKRKRKKYPAYKLFCASRDAILTNRFRRFATKTQAYFVDASKSQGVFNDLQACEAYLYILDFETYQSIREELDTKYETEPIKPLICIAGEKPFTTPINVSEWVQIWEFLTDEQLLSLINQSRSRIRAKKA